MDEMIRKIDDTKYELLKKEVVDIQDLLFRKEALLSQITSLQQQLTAFQEELNSLEEQIAVFQKIDTSTFVSLDQVKEEVKEELESLKQIEEPQEKGDLK